TESNHTRSIFYPQISQIDADYCEYCIGERPDFRPRVKSSALICEICGSFVSRVAFAPVATFLTSLFALRFRCEPQQEIRTERRAKTAKPDKVFKKAVC